MRVSDFSALGTRGAVGRMIARGARGRMMTRRGFVVLAGATAVASGVGIGRARAAGLAALVAELARLERDSGGRLGGALLDTHAATPVAHRCDVRDTRTPIAMLNDVNKLVLGDAVTPASRAHLVGWLVANKTGGARLRAGLPTEWRIGDKTGSGEHGTANDVGVIWPPGRAPLIVSAYLTGTDASMDQRNAIHAGIGRAVAAAPG